MRLLDHITDAEILSAISGGCRTGIILDRLRLPDRFRKGEHLWLAALRRRLRRMEREGLVRLSDRYSFDNSFYWEPVT